VDCVIDFSHNKDIVVGQFCGIEVVFRIIDRTVVAPGLRSLCGWCSMSKQIMFKSRLWRQWEYYRFLWCLIVTKQFFQRRWQTS